MTDTPYPIPRGARKTDVLVGDGGTVYGPFVFKIFDIEDVEVWARPAGADDYAVATVTVAKLANTGFDDFTVTFASPQPSTTQMIVFGSRIYARSAGVLNGTRIDPTALEKEFSKIAATLQELRRDVIPANPYIPENATLVIVGGRLTAGPDLSELAADVLAEAQAYAQAAGTAADEADADRVLAQASSALANASANTAQTLVLQATAGFLGFQSGLAYDFGSITEATTYFDQDWGTI